MMSPRKSLADLVDYAAEKSGYPSVARMLNAPMHAEHVGAAVGAALPWAGTYLLFYASGVGPVASAACTGVAAVVTDLIRFRNKELPPYTIGTVACGCFGYLAVQEYKRWQQERAWLELTKENGSGI